MDTLLPNLLIIALCILGLWGGATWIVEAATRIARRLGLSELIIGLTIVAVGTSAPEFAVTLSAAFRGQADISVGNVVGSNIFNLGFILGGVAMVRAISTSRALVFRDGGFLIAATLLLLFFLRDFSLDWSEGLILLALLSVYIIYLIRQRETVDLDDIPNGAFHWTAAPQLLVGLGLVALSGHYLVHSATIVARLAGLSEWIIGVTIVAAGTSLPEVATSLVAVIRGHYGLSAGNLIGSDLFNLLGVLGLAALLRPLTVDSSAYGSMALLSGLVILVVFMMRTGWILSRREGALLIAINLARWIFDFAYH